MAIEEKEQQETLLKNLIEKIEKDPLPTNIFTIEDTDPLVLLGKLNEVIAILKTLRGLISSSDTKASEALTKALDALIKAGEAIQTAQEAKATAETIGNEAKATADNALEIASKAQEKAEVADSTAIEAVNDATEAISRANEALQKANEALSQVVEGLGTKVYDSENNLLANAHFEGQNGINITAENETFKIKLEETLTQTIEDTKAQSQSNKTNIDAVSNRVTTNEADIVNLVNMISSVEEDVDTKLVKKTGDTMTGSLNVTNTNRAINCYSPTHYQSITLRTMDSDPNYILEEYEGTTSRMYWVCRDKINDHNLGIFYLPVFSGTKEIATTDQLLKLTNFNDNNITKIIQSNEKFILIQRLSYKSTGRGWHTITLPTALPAIVNPQRGVGDYAIIVNHNVDIGDHITHLIRNKTDTNFELYTWGNYTLTAYIIAVH